MDLGHLLAVINWADQNTKSNRGNPCKPKGRSGIFLLQDFL